MPKKKKVRKPKVLEYDERFYIVGDEFYPRVTTILEALDKPALRFWYGLHGTDKATELSEEAKDRGSRIHDAIERLLRGRSINLEKEFPDPKEKKMLLGFRNWFEEYKPTDIIPEHTIFSHKHKIAGTLDILCKIGGEEIVIDVKTSKAIYPEYALQLAAYRNMVCETSSLKPTKTFVLRLTERGKKHYEWKDVTEDAVFKTFLAVKRVWEYLNKDDLQPKEPETFPKTLQIIKPAKKGVKKKK